MRDPYNIKFIKVVREWRCNTTHSSTPNYVEISGHLHASDASTPGQRIQCPLNIGLFGYQKRCGSFGKEVNLRPVRRIEQRFIGHPVHKVVTIPTELVRLVLRISGN
jgi:hypothetical protein